MEAHVLSRQVGLAAWARLSASATEAEALAKREEDSEDNRDQDLSLKEDRTDKIWSAEEEILSMPLAEH